MVQVPVQPLTLDSFLELPETQPASEFMGGVRSQKPMPQGEHRLLQVALCKTIDDVAEPQRLANAFSELRCIFGGATIVPDVSVFRWQRIPRKPSGRVANRFEIYPDWAIEILSPEQAQTKPLEKWLHCLDHGTELGWLLDPDADSVIMISADSRINLYRGKEILPVLRELELVLSAQTIFSCLSLPE